MKYAGIIYNDITAAPGLSVTFFSQGCPHRCEGCHNPETWDFDGGKDFPAQEIENIIAGLTAQGIRRNLCIMGGEPLAEQNEFLTYMLIKSVKDKLPHTPIYIWTGYTHEELLNRSDNRINQILELTNYLIDGRYIKSLRDITLDMRGSSNQRIIELHPIDN